MHLTDHAGWKSTPVGNWLSSAAVVRMNAHPQYDTAEASTSQRGQA